MISSERILDYANKLKEKLTQIYPECNWHIYLNSMENDTTEFSITYGGQKRNLFITIDRNENLFTNDENGNLIEFDPINIMKHYLNDMFTHCLQDVLGNIKDNNTIPDLIKKISSIIHTI